MEKVGPKLPPHIAAAREAKRRRLAEAGDKTEKSEAYVEKKVIGPALPGQEEPEAKKRVIGPTLPGQEEPDLKKRVIGPTLPGLEDTKEEKKSLLYVPDYDIEEPKHDKVKLNGRDEWMMIPPSKSDWAAKQADPLNLRNRKFMTGSSAPTIAEPDASWLETEDERKTRLAEEAMGIRKRRDKDSTAPVQSQPSERDLELARQVKEYNEQMRGKSLLEEYQAKGTKKGKLGPDDPSKRGFDYEKDVASAGRTIGGSNINEFVKRASEMDSKFAKGRFL